MNITITDNAALKAVELFEGNSSRVIRISIKNGGCSGFQYDFSMEDNSEVNSEISNVDHVFQRNGATFVIDPVSSIYVDGITVDYVKSVSGEQFLVSNPNARAVCGCNLSFTL